MGDPAERRYTWDEYLALERETGVKHEYVQGYVYAMSGGTRAHSRLAARVITFSELALAGKPCSTYTSDLRVWMPHLNRARYPDVTVVCGDPDGDEHDRTVTTGPTVIFGVTSPSTGQADRGETWAKATPARASAGVDRTGGTQLPPQLPWVYLRKKTSISLPDW